MNFLVKYLDTFFLKHNIFKKQQNRVLNELFGQISGHKCFFIYIPFGDLRYLLFKM